MFKKKKLYPMPVIRIDADLHAMALRMKKEYGCSWRELIEESFKKMFAVPAEPILDKRICQYCSREVVGCFFEMKHTPNLFACQDCYGKV